MAKAMIAAGALISLGACSGGMGGDSGELQPGEWQITREVTELGIPDMPEELLNALTEEREAGSVCLSEEEAADPGPTLFAPSTDALDCTYDTVSYSEGTVSARGQCTTPASDIPGVTTIEGSYTSTTLEVEWDFEREVEGETQRSFGTIRSERTGDC